jgi:hypothetical protein
MLRRTSTVLLASGLTALLNVSTPASQIPGRVIEPVVVDLAANGFSLTSVEDGVRFDLDLDGVPDEVGWTARGSDDAFLAMDRTQSGSVAAPHLLFGGMPPGVNGFDTLGQFENDPMQWLRSPTPLKTGPEPPGIVDESDPVFHRLILWVDANHNGLSEADEMRSPQSVGLVQISSGYEGTSEREQHGNLFRYKAKVLVKNAHGVPVYSEARAVRFVIKR